MTALEELTRAFDEFERIQSDITVIGSQPVEGWQKRLVEQRRTLQANIVRLREAGVACDGGRVAGKALAEYQQALSAMRTAMALHQAQWPAVTIDQENPDYQQSQLAVRKATGHFRTIAKQLIADLKS